MMMMMMISIIIIIILHSALLPSRMAKNLSPFSVQLLCIYCLIELYTVFPFQVGSSQASYMPINSTSECSMLENPTMKQHCLEDYKELYLWTLIGDHRQASSLRSVKVSWYW